jgi:hypothetical protein
VQAEALEIVQKIVAAGDAGEEVVDFRGTLITGRIIDVAHADRLTVATGAAKPRNVFALGGGFARFVPIFKRLFKHQHYEHRRNAQKNSGSG